MTRSRTRLAMDWNTQQTAALLLLCGVAIAVLGWAQVNRLAWPAGATDPAAIAMGRERIDPNIASTGSLQRLPGIGPSLAGGIIAYRDAQPFSTPGDLEKVSGIGPAKMAAVRDMITVGR